MFAGIAPRYDLMSEVLSYGQNRRWRRFLVSRIPARSRVLDVATGTAAVAIDLARLRECEVVGIDQSETMLASGRERALAAGVDVRLTLGRAEQLPFADGEFDALTFTYLLRYVDDVPATLAELARVVRPGGMVASLEFGLPDASIWRLGWRLQTAVALPALGALASREWREAGRFLGPSIREHRRRWPPAREAAAWRGAGIAHVRVRQMSLGAGVVTWGVRSAG